MIELDSPTIISITPSDLFKEWLLRYAHATTSCLAQSHFNFNSKAVDDDNVIYNVWLNYRFQFKLKSVDYLKPNSHVHLVSSI